MSDEHSFDAWAREFLEFSRDIAEHTRSRLLPSIPAESRPTYERGFLRVVEGRIEILEAYFDGPRTDADRRGALDAIRELDQETLEELHADLGDSIYGPEVQ